MTQIKDLDIEAAEREGLILIKCLSRRCTQGNPVLALQSPDGRELKLNGGVSVGKSQARVRLTCDCGYTRSWRRASQGANTQ